MKPEDRTISVRVIAAVTCLAFLASCATAPHTVRGPEYAPTAKVMREARSVTAPVAKRAADYLQAAALTAPLLGTGIGTPPVKPTTQRAAKSLFCCAQVKEDGCGIDR